MGNYYDENGVYHVIAKDDDALDGGRYGWKGSSTKTGNNCKDIAKRRKKNKNKKTHRR